MEYWGFSICEADEGRSHGATLESLLATVDIADRGGMDGWFFAEHHGNPSYSLTSSPNLLVAAASQRTRQIRLGNMVTVMAFHHPLRVAEEIRMLDALTGGRLETGIGRGGFPHERAAWGIDAEEVDARFEAGVHLVMRFLTEELVDYDTPWWRGRSAIAVPQATQRPHPPMWLAVISDASLRLAAEEGLHCNTSFSYPELLRERISVYKQAWEEHHPGHVPGKLGVLVQVVVGETRREAERYGKEFVERRLQRFIGGVGAKSQGPPRSDGRERIHQHISALDLQGFIDEGLVVFGSVEECAEQLARLRAMGVDAVTAWVRFEGMDERFARESLGRLIDEVIPRVEGRQRSGRQGAVADSPASG